MSEYQIPTLDFEAVAAMDDEARTEALNAYNAAVATLRETLAADAKGEAETQSALAAARYDAAKYKMASDRTLAGFADAMDEIERIIADTPALSAMPDEERLRTAYYIARGRQPAKEPAAPTAEELFAALEKNPAAMRMVEARMLELLGKDSAPALFATAGNASAPATVREKPKTIDEASGLARAAFGI